MPQQKDEMKRVSRLDFGQLEKPVRTPQGGIRAPAYLTRADAVFVYYRADGTVIREFRPAAEVFREDSLQSLVGAPVTDRHPPVMVTSANFKQYASGHVGDSVRQDGERVAADVIIQDGGLLEAVERRDRVEVSCGYTCEIEESPGEHNGERFDRIQRNIRYNHVAIVERGRAGGDVSLRLDSSENVLAPSGPEQPKERQYAMKPSIRIDGVEYPLTTDAEITAAVSAFNRYDGRLTAELATLRKDAEETKGRLDAANKEAKEAKDKLAAETKPERLDALVSERFQLRADAETVLGKEAKLDGLSDRDVMVKAVAHAMPETKLDGLSDDRLRGMFHGVVGTAKRKAAEDPDGLGKLRADAEDTASGRKDPDAEKDPVRAAKARMDEYNSTAWEQPLAITKDSPTA